jgi:hypothetical protein
MRKPRDFDSELKALEQKAKQLRTRKVQQLGELAIACGTDALTIEELAGALLDAADANTATKEAWRRRGAGFFRKRGEDGNRAEGSEREPQTRGGAA